MRASRWQNVPVKVAALGSGVAILVAGVSASSAESTGSQSQSAAAPNPIASGFAGLTDANGVPTEASVTGDPLGEFQWTLMNQFRKSYGGFYQNPDKSFTIIVVGSDPALESTAQQLFSNVASQYNTTVPTSISTLTFVPGTFSLVSLYEAQHEINSEIDSAVQAQVASDAQTTADASQPVGLFGSGIDMIHNQIVVESDGSPEASSQFSAISSTYGAMVGMQVKPRPVLTDRTNDTSPWNGGDDLGSCTLGFGVHIAAGAYYSLTDGHCGAGVWYTPYFGANLVGTTVDGTWSDNTIDVQLIGDSSSALIWKGPIGSATRLTIQGDANPPAGGDVCLEGSHGGEKCGTVGLVDQHATFDDQGQLHTIYYMFTTNVEPSPGDSGGPVWYSSPFGNLAAGTIEAAVGFGYSNEIDALLFIESYAFGTSVIMNTTS